MKPSPLGNQTTNVAELLIRDRVLFCTGQVDNALSNLLVSQLLYLDREDPTKPIYMLVNSLGGLVVSGMAIVDTMNLIRPPVHTICIGYAMSMGAVLLGAGEKGHRSALPNASIMVHQPSSGMAGAASDMKIEMAETSRIKTLLHEVLAGQTGQSIEKIAQDSDRNFYMTSQDAVEYGLIDRVLTKLPDYGS